MYMLLPGFSVFRISACSKIFRLNYGCIQSKREGVLSLMSTNKLPGQIWPLLSCWYNHRITRLENVTLIDRIYFRPYSGNVRLFLTSDHFLVIYGHFHIHFGLILITGRFQVNSGPVDCLCFSNHFECRLLSDHIRNFQTLAYSFKVESEPPDHDFSSYRAQVTSWYSAVNTTQFRQSFLVTSDYFMV